MTLQTERQLLEAAAALVSPVVVQAPRRQKQDSNSGYLIDLANHPGGAPLSHGQHLPSSLVAGCIDRRSLESASCKVRGWNAYRVIVRRK